MAATHADTAHHGSPHRWSQHVTETSDAMDLKQGVFKLSDPKKIAQSLKTSAEHSDRRKADPYRSAMSMLTFYVNRAGHGLSTLQHQRLEKAKDELRALFGKPPRKASAKTKANPKARAGAKATTKAKAT